MPHCRINPVAGSVICSLIAMLGIGMALQFWRVLPFIDHWAAVYFYRDWIERGLTIVDFAALHNEHRPALPRLLFCIDFLLARGTSTFLNPFLLLTQLSLGALLGLLVTAGMGAQDRALGVTMAVAFLASPVHIDNLVLPFHVAIPLVCILALLAFLCTARVGVQRSSRSAWSYAGGAAAAVALCPYTMANGVIAAAMAACLAWKSPRRNGPATFITATAIGAIAFYFWGWEPTKDHEPLQATFGSLAGVRHAALHPLALLGSAAHAFHGMTGNIAAIGVGLAGAMIWIATSLHLLVRRRYADPLAPDTLSLFMLATFIVASALVIAWGRAGVGAGQGLSTRYATFSLVFWISLLGTVWRLAPDFGARGDLVRGAVPVTAALLLVLAYAAWFRVADTQHARAAASDVVSAELRAGRFDPAHVSLVYPMPEEIRRAVDFLREQRLSIFAD